MHDELLDEARLRRALRLEPTELPPRLDVATLVARAASPAAAPLLASLASTVLAGIAAAALIALGASAAAALVPAMASDTFGASMAALARIAVPLEAILAAAQQPSIPIAVLTATVLTVVHEFRQRRENADAVRAT